MRSTPPTPEGRSGAILGRWRRLGFLLPSGVRERVYEPALTDLWLRWIAPPTGRRPPFALHAAGTLFGCIPLAMATLFVERGHLTRFARVSLRVVVGLVTLVAALQVAAELFGAYE